MRPRVQRLSELQSGRKSRFCGNVLAFPVVRQVSVVEAGGQIFIAEAATDGDLVPIGEV
ncbi:MAG: hypothetical protein J0I17_07885 ['Candidatus Kapabacteria' thiocyanatum]|nr:hypothetical protein ['Candidatus Kapabacteria' thiocyanatum]